VHYSVKNWQMGAKKVRVFDVFIQRFTQAYKTGHRQLIPLSIFSTVYSKNVRNAGSLREHRHGDAFSIRW